MGFIRLVVFGFIILSAIYAMVWFYSRSIRREKLENQWAEHHPDDTDSPDRDAFIEAGMERYYASIRPKLILLVYVVPTLIVAAIHILTTYY
ncbi:MAG: hypothetical protein CSA70_00785 [Rhodobacterales bacterium]|nr:MAG: hypothetical protein CSA70_00785 [Rhodobacterales bacterium]